MHKLVAAVVQKQNATEGTVSSEHRAAFNIGRKSLAGQGVSALNGATATNKFANKWKAKSRHKVGIYTEVTINPIYTLFRKKSNFFEVVFFWGKSVYL